MDNIDNHSPLYGIWIPRRGWLKVSKPGGGLSAYADANHDVARSVAHRYGNGARVEYVDESLIALEAAFLDREYQRSLAGRTQRLWHTLTSLYHKQSKTTS